MDQEIEDGLTKISIKTVKTLYRQTNAENDDPSKIIVPRFQRQFVWSKQQKKDFIRSLIKDWPVGSILLYEAEDGLYLIDGLQRTNTIKEYLSGRKEFASISSENPEIESCLDQIATIFNTDLETIGKVIENWIHSINDFSSRREFTARKAIEYFTDDSSYINKKLTDDEKNELYDIFDTKGLLDAIEKSNNIDNKKIVAVTYRGNIKEIPVIFEMINSAGTPLNPYQIYAATWVDRKIITDRKELIKIINLRYEMIKERSFHHEVSKDLEPTDEITIYEFIYAHSMHIARKFGPMFGFNKSQVDKLYDKEELSSEDLKSFIGSEDDVESFIFNLYSIIFKCIHERQKLPDKIEKQEGGLNSIDYISKNLETAILEVEKIFFKLFNFKTQIHKGKKSTFHSEYQIIAIVAKVYSFWFMDGDKHLEHKKIVPRDEHMELRKFLIKSYINDIFDESKWSGHGDNEAIKFAFQDDFASLPSRNDFKEILNKWYNKRKTNTDFRNIKRDDKATKFIVYANFIQTSPAYEKYSDLEIDHIFNKTFTSPDPNDEDRLLRHHINSPGNLCLIRRRNNLIKGKKQLNKDIFKEYESFLGDNDRIMISKLSNHPDTITNIDEVQDLFDEFIDERFEHIANTICDIYENWFNNTTLTKN